MSWRFSKSSPILSASLLELPMNRCPCTSGKPYAICCKPYHKGKLPKTPDALMRSRFAAYHQGNVEYIIHTTDPDGPMWEENQEEWEEAIRAFSLQTTFEKLTILDMTDTTVTFRAKLFQAGIDVSFTEKSSFSYSKNMWLYHSGEILSKAT